jgi:hypothetical protein
MLMYLGNGFSVANGDEPTSEVNQLRRAYHRVARPTSHHVVAKEKAPGSMEMAPSSMEMTATGMEMAGTTVEMRPVSTQSLLRPVGLNSGLNENYGREVMELHTLGVEGGYTQADITQVARALSGWKIYPMKEGVEATAEHIAGAIIQGDFVYRGDFHDAGPKTILGRRFPAGGGLAEGEAVLRMLATHPSTARFISRKLAVHFVSDNPPEELVKHLAEVFRRSGGDTRELLRAMVESDEFWAPDARGAKVKSPVELMASAIRALNADIDIRKNCYDWYRWVELMGQPLYSYASPTGFGDRADTWVTGGLMLARLNFLTALVNGRLRGIDVDISRLSGSRRRTPEFDVARVAHVLLAGHDVDLELAAGRLLGVKIDPPPSASDSKRTAQLELERVAHFLLPGRDVERTLRLLRPIVSRKIKAGATDQELRITTMAGVILGSPEFQVR